MTPDEPCRADNAQTANPFFPSLNGQIALVTGGSSGIGAATVEALAGAGATVVIGDHQGRERAEALRARLPGNGHQLLRLALEDEATHAAAARELGESFGRLHILVNSAGYTQRIAHRDLAALTPSLSLPYLASGKLDALAVSSDTRLAQLPQVPTLKELGYAPTGVYAWQGLVAPKATPAPIVAQLSGEVQTALALPAVQRKLTELGMEPTPGDAAAMARLVAREQAFWGPLIKARGIKSE